MGRSHFGSDSQAPYGRAGQFRAGGPKGGDEPLACGNPKGRVTNIQIAPQQFIAPSQRIRFTELPK